MSTIDAYASIAELGAMLRDGRTTSVELTRFYLDRLESMGSRLGAVVTVTRARAEAEAARADREAAAGRWRGPLHGIPYGVKDLLATVGAPTTWGAEPYRDQVFDFDATVVRKLEEAGAVLCAKLAMVELAGGFGYNTADASFTGPGRSPFHPDFWSGGSSSGPGAAVGAALVPFAIGSETSGSILTPAAFSGVSGFRPTYGVVSRHGAMALCWSLDKLGPMARSVEDCELVMREIVGRDPKDPTSRDLVGPPTTWPNRLTVGLVRGTWERVQPAVRENFERTLAEIRALGHTTIELDYPDYPWGSVVGTIVDAEGASAFEDILRSGRAKMLRAEADRLGGYQASTVLAIDYLRAMRIRRKGRGALLRLFEQVDVIVAPTRSTVAYPVGIEFQKAYPGVSAGPSLIGSMNLAGAPAVAFPSGLGENGLPTSVQVVAAPFRDAELLELGASIQARLPQVRPTGHAWS